MVTTLIACQGSIVMIRHIARRLTLPAALPSSITSSASMLQPHPQTTHVLQDGWTPLFVAAQNGHLEVVRLLLDKGANMEAANNVGAVRLPH